MFLCFYNLQSFFGRQGLNEKDLDLLCSFVWWLDLWSKFDLGLYTIHYISVPFAPHQHCRGERVTLTGHFCVCLFLEVSEKIKIAPDSNKAYLHLTRLFPPQKMFSMYCHVAFEFLVSVLCTVSFHRITLSILTLAYFFLAINETNENCLILSIFFLSFSLHQQAVKQSSFTREARLCQESNLSNSRCQSIPLTRSKPPSIHFLDPLKPEDLGHRGQLESAPAVIGRRKGS